MQCGIFIFGPFSRSSFGRYFWIKIYYNSDFFGSQPRPTVTEKLAESVKTCWKRQLANKLN